jgi:hypothetical protein
MAKVATKKTASKTPAKTSAPKESTKKLGVGYLADKLGLDPFTVRVKLRDAGAEKTGRSYEFTQKQADDLVKKFSKKEKKED